MAGSTNNTKIESAILADEKRHPLENDHGISITQFKGSKF